MGRGRPEAPARLAGPGAPAAGWTVQGTHSPDVKDLVMQELGSPNGLLAVASAL